MARVALEAIQERVLANLLAKSQTKLEAAGEFEVSEWLSHPLTIALEELIDADILQLQLQWSSNGLDSEQAALAKAKIEIYSQVRDYLTSGHNWLEELRIERESEEEEKEDA